MENVTEIFHPKTKELKGTVTELSEPTQFGDKFESSVDYTGGMDWHETFEEAKEYVEKQLENVYIGGYGRTVSEDWHTERQERLCGA